MTDITKLLDEHPLPWCAKPWAIDGVALHDANDKVVPLDINTWDDANFVLALANALHAERKALPKALDEAAELRAAIHSLPDFYDDDGEPTWNFGRIEAVKRQLEEWKRYKRNVEERQKRDQNEIDALKHRLNRDMPVYVDEPYKIPPLNDSGDVDALRYRVDEIGKLLDANLPAMRGQITLAEKRIGRAFELIGDLERIVRDGERFEAIEKRLDAIANAARGSDE